MANIDLPSIEACILAWYEKHDPEMVVIIRGILRRLLNDPRQETLRRLLLQGFAAGFETGCAVERFESSKQH